MDIEDFKGYIEFRNEVFPFIFKDSLLTIIPPTIEKWNESYIKWFHKNFGESIKNKWLDKIIIDGITDRHKGVKFFATDNPAFFNGYYTYKVNYLYIYDFKSGTKEMYEIIGLRFKGPECNYFYDVSSYINEDFKTKDNRFSTFSLKILSKDDEDFGKFRWHNYSISIKGSFSWKKDNNTYSPLEVNSMIVLELSRTCNDLKKLIELIHIQENVLSFCTYRKNITFKEIDTYTYTEEQLRRKTGNFYIFNENETESNTKHLQKIVDLKNTKKFFSNLYKMVSDGDLYTSHICQNYAMIKSYYPARILSILIAFEHNYKTIYKNISLSSAEFNIAKEKTIEFLDNKISEETGKLKKKYRGIRNSINKTDLGYGEYLKYALYDNFKILEPFIKQRYHVKDAKVIIGKCSERINTIRNSMAHGTLDIKFKPINSNDIFLVELLLYSMTLKYIGLDIQVIQNKIKKLFNI